MTDPLEKLLKDIGVEGKREQKNVDILDNLRNSLKMLVFLSIYFLNNTCIKKNKNSLKDELNEATNNNKEGPGANKKTNKASKKNKDLSKELQSTLIEKQGKNIHVLQKTISQDNMFLWQNKGVDEEYFKYFLEISLKMLESKQLLKDCKESKENIFSILENTLAGNTGSLKNIEIKLINLIYEEETLVDPISDFIVKAYNSKNINISKLATETLTMLINYILEKTNTTAESQAVKNTRELLCKTCQSIPKAFYTNLSSFITLFDSESYLLRNALCDILCEIIKQVLTSKSEDEDEDNKENRLKAKNRFLDKLVKRINDKHAYSRSHLLKVFLDLCNSNVVPKEYLSVLLKCACDRIKDVSAHVRKKALELIIILVDLYHGIFVGNKDQGFMSKDELEREKKFNEAEILQVDKGIKDHQELLKRILDDSEEHNEKTEDLKILQKKKDTLIAGKLHIQEYNDVLNMIDKVLNHFKFIIIIF